MSGDKGQRVCRGVMITPAVIDAEVDGRSQYQLLPKNARICVIIEPDFADDVSDTDMVEARMAFDEAMIEQQTTTNQVDIQTIQDELAEIASAVQRIHEKVGDPHSRRIDMHTANFNIRIVRAK